MDKTDEKILSLLQGNARMSFQELGDALGMSRVAAKKRVTKLEKESIIRGYNTCIYRDGEITVLIDIVTMPEKFEEVLKYVSMRTINVRKIFTTTKENHIHMEAVSDSIQNLKYMTNIISKHCGEGIVEYHVHAVKEVVKDVYGGVSYDDYKRGKDPDGADEQHSGSRTKGKA